MSTRKTKNLTRLIEEQESLLKAIKNEAKEIDGDSLTAENERLSTELEDYKAKLENSAYENENLKKQLNETKAVLFAKMTNEKLEAFDRAQRRIDAMYYMGDDGITSRLRKYEEGCKKSLDDTLSAIERSSFAEYEDIRKKLYELRSEINSRAMMLERKKNEQLNNMAITNNAVGASLKNEPLTESEKRVASQQKSLESFIGLNILSKAGILLFLIGIVLLGRFAYSHMNDMLKGVMVYLLGGALIGGGEFLHRKEKTVFSQALISGGTAVLYAAAATGYFAFHLYGESVTFIICILITALGIFLSNQLKSQVVCAFAAVGGYLPVVVSYMMTFGKVAADKTFLPVSCVYFCALALVIFIMTYNKKWYAPQFIGYALHLIALGGVISSAYSLRTLDGFEYAPALAVVFSVASFIIYMFMPGSKIFAGKTVLTEDTVLLGINTLSGAVSVGISIRNCFPNANENRAMGFVFLAFAILYGMLMAFSVREKKNASLGATVITSVSTVIFSMLVVPLVFGFDWAPIAWAAEGIIIALIGLNKELRATELAGFICMIAAFCAEVVNGDYTEALLLTIVSYSVIIAVFWIYTVSGLSRKNEHGIQVFYTVLEIIVCAGTVVHLIKIYNCIISGPAVTLYSRFTDFSVAVIIIALMAIVLRFSVLKNDVSLLISNITGSALVFGVAFAQLDNGIKYNRILDFYFNNVTSKSYEIINLILLGIIVIGSMLFFTKAIADLIERFDAPVWIYTFSISLAALLLSTVTAMQQFDIKFSSFILSGIYIAIACVMLFIGFKKSFTVVRSGGLVLILAAFAKLCFVDTFHLVTAWKIVSYFAFGAILIGISYVYQRFTKKLEE